MRIAVFWFIVILLFTGCTANSNHDPSVDHPAVTNSKYPYLNSSEDTLYMSWLTATDSSSYSLQYASYNDKKWNPPQTIASDSSWFVNWADYPSITVHSNGMMAAHWLNKRAGGPYSYDVNVSLTDSAKRWSPPITPHNDNTASEHGFVSIIPWNHNSFLMVWLDGRRTANRPEGNYSDITKAMTLRGALISAGGEIRKRFLIDDAVCDCCQTSLTKTPNGAIVAYRNRTGEEVRDIYISRFNGNSWSTPQAVHHDNWEIGACPVNGPKVVADDSTVAVAWHTGATPTPTTKVAISTDSGLNFGQPKKLNNQTSLGRVDAAVSDEQLFISWMESGTENAILQLATIDRTSKQKTTKTISAINKSRKTGFPQMEIVGNQLFFAWTNVDSATPKIEMKSIPLPQ